MPKSALKEIYYVKPIDNSRFEPVTDSRLPRQYLLILFVAAALFCFGHTSESQRFCTVSDGYRIEQLQREKQTLLVAHHKLLMEEASLVNPVRIDMIARRDLGMMKLAAPRMLTSPAASAPEPAVVADAGRDSGALALQVRNIFAAAVP